MRDHFASAQAGASRFDDSAADALNEETIS
jgi:hypothetical protein